MCGPEEWLSLARRAGLTSWYVSSGQFHLMPGDEAGNPQAGYAAAALEIAMANDMATLTDWVERHEYDQEIIALNDGSARRVQLFRGPSCGSVHYGLARQIEGGLGRRQFEQKLLTTMMDALLQGGRGFMMLIGVRDLDRVREGLGQMAIEGLFEDVERRLVHVCYPLPVYRISGGVFGVVGCCDAFDERTKAARILDDTFGSPFEVAGLLQRLMGRAGIAVFPEDGGNVEELLHSCSLALSAALRSREDLVKRAEVGQVDEMREQSLLASVLMDGIVEHQFRFELQPIIELKSGRVVSAEALARWNHPVLGEVSPARFVPLAERQEVMMDATLSMMRRMSREVQPQSLPDMRIAINIAPSDFNRRTVTRLVDTIKDEKLLPLDRLTLEITETGMMQQDVRETFALADSLHHQNIYLAIDDFGTGYSSFGNLSVLPLDLLKIDRSLAQDVHKLPQKARMLAAITSMAEPLGMKTVVEGLECAEEIEAVRAIGCDRVQGFFYSRPLSSERFLEFCKEKQTV